MEYEEIQVFAYQVASSDATPAALEEQSFRPLILLSVAAAEKKKSLRDLSKMWSSATFPAEKSVFCLSSGMQVDKKKTLEQYISMTTPKPKQPQPDESRDDQPQLVPKAFVLIPETATIKGFEKAFKESGALVAFCSIQTPGSKENPTETKISTAKSGSMELVSFLKKCGAQSEHGLQQVSMLKVKSAMAGQLSLASQFDIWVGTSAKLLDYETTFQSYCEHVWNQDAELGKKSQFVIYYGLKRDHSTQTVQQIYDAKTFLIKFVSMKTETPQTVGSVQIKEKGASKANGEMSFETLESMELKAFRRLVPTMSGLANKDEFCLPDKSPVEDMMRFSSYVTLLDEENPYEDAMPSLSLRFTASTSRFHGGEKARTALSTLVVNHKVTPEDRSSLVTQDPKLLEYENLRKELINVEGWKIENVPTLGQAASLDEASWGYILKSCNALYGWYFDDITNQIKMAPKPAFNLRPGLYIGENTRPPVVSSDAAANEDATTPAKQSGASSDTPLKHDKPNAIPSYRVNDDSKIEVLTADSTSTESLIRNNFQKSSTEGKVSVGYDGFGLGVQAGYSQEHEEGHGMTKQKYSRKMIGKYLLPRVTLLLSPEDLVATDEMISHAKKIRDNKNPTDVRDFYQRFGQYFSHEVTIGGMLTSTRTIKATDDLAEDKTKDAFKTAIGLSVSTPVDIGIEVKHEKTSGGDTSHISHKKDINDRVAFEAVGGNTILAFSPQDWCASVSDYKNWRVIERADLKRLTDSMAGCATDEIKSISTWLAETKPTPWMDSIEIPPSREVHAQIRFLLTGENMSTQFLVHDVASTITMFKGPTSFQGPRIRSYNPKNPWKANDGVWVIVVHNTGEKLVDGSKVSIRTRHDLETKRFMTVLRTAEQVFVPCISTSGHEPIWTIRKAPSAAEDLSAIPTGEPLSDDGRFCLTFDFQENNRGYRDFFNDPRGYRRRNYALHTNQRLVLAQAATSQPGWLDKNILVMVDEKRSVAGQQFLKVNMGQGEAQVDIARFYLDVLASDGTDEDTDILLMDSEKIIKNDDERRAQIKQGGKITQNDDQK